MKAFKVYPLGTMNVSTKLHNNYVYSVQNISLKAKNVNLLMEIQLKLQDNK